MKIIAPNLSKKLVDFAGRPMTCLIISLMQKSNFKCCHSRETEIRDKIESDLEKEPIKADNNDFASSYRFGDYPGRINFISDINKSSCDKCNRLRLTSNGYLVGCL